MQRIAEGEANWPPPPLVIAGTGHIARYTHPLGFPEMNANPRGEPNEHLVVDYISSMTDPFATAIFESIFVLAPGT
jgi:hypothetical protein